MDTVLEPSTVAVAVGAVGGRPCPGSAATAVAPPAASLKSHAPRLSDGLGGDAFKASSKDGGDQPHPRLGKSKRSSLSPTHPGRNRPNAQDGRNPQPPPSVGPSPSGGNTGGDG